MLKQFIKKEILDSLLNQRFLALAAFSIILMPLSAVINYEYYQVRRASFDSAFNEYQQKEGRRWTIRAYRPPEVMSSLARGTEPYMPVYYQFTQDASATEPGNIEAQEFSTLSTFGGFDFLFLAQIVFSLLAILLAFDMIAGEKERGTLKAVLANHVPRDAIIFGKFVGGFVVLWLVFLIGFLLFYLVLTAYDPRFLALDSIARVLTMFGISTLFLAGFYSLGLMISTLTHSTRTAIVALLVLWVILQLVIPKAGEKIANALVVVRSDNAVRVEKAKIVEELDNASSTEGGKIYTRVTGRSDFLGAFELLSSDTPEAQRVKEEYQAMRREYEQQQHDRVRAVDEAFAREKEQLKRTSRSIALFSPAPALAFLMTDVAGTGDLANQKYKEAISTYYQTVDRNVYAKRRNSRYRLNLDGSSISSSFGNNDDNEEEELPAFSVPKPTLSEVFQANVWALVTLLAYVIIPFLIAYVAFLRYDVR